MDAGQPATRPLEPPAEPQPAAASAAVPALTQLPEGAVWAEEVVSIAEDLRGPVLGALTGVVLCTDPAQASAVLQRPEVRTAVTTTGIILRPGERIGGTALENSDVAITAQITELSEAKCELVQYQVKAITGGSPTLTATGAGIPNPASQVLTVAPAVRTGTCSIANGETDIPAEIMSGKLYADPRQPDTGIWAKIPAGTSIEGITSPGAGPAEFAGMRVERHCITRDGVCDATSMDSFRGYFQDHPKYAAENGIIPSTIAAEAAASQIPALA